MLQSVNPAESATYNKLMSLYQNAPNYSSGVPNPVVPTERFLRYLVFARLGCGHALFGNLYHHSQSIGLGIYCFGSCRSEVGQQ